MPGSLSWFDDSWPAEDGWPYPDAGEESDALDPEAAMDDDLVSLHALRRHLFDGLDPLERQVVTARFGLDDGRPHSMRELQHDLGVSRADLRVALGGGLAKLRDHLI